MLFPVNKKEKKCQERTTRRRKRRKKEGSAADGRFGCLGEYGEMIKETESRPQREKDSVFSLVYLEVQTTQFHTADS